MLLVHVFSPQLAPVQFRLPESLLGLVQCCAWEEEILNGSVVT